MEQATDQMNHMTVTCFSPALLHSQADLATHLRLGCHSRLLELGVMFLQHFVNLHQFSLVFLTLRAATIFALGKHQK